MRHFIFITSSLTFVLFYSLKKKQIMKNKQINDNKTIKKNLKSPKNKKQKKQKREKTKRIIERKFKKRKLFYLKVH